MYKLLLILVIFLLAFPATAFAYIDPGTGSLILQILLAGFAGLGVLLKLFWHRICGLFGMKNTAVAENEVAENTEVERAEVNK